MATASEALVVTTETEIRFALNDTDAMKRLADKAKEITKSLIAERDFDIEVAEDRAEIKRIGRRVARTAKDINECGVAYLRDTKSKIKEVEKRKKWFSDELAIVRASVDGPAVKWEQDRKDVDNAIARFATVKFNADALTTLETLTEMLNEQLATPEKVVEDKQVEYSAARNDVIGHIKGRMDIVEINIARDAKLKKLEDEKLKRDADELEALRKLKAAGEISEKPPERPVEAAAPDDSHSLTEDTDLFVNELETRCNELECLCVDLYNEFASGDAHFTREMTRLELLPVAEEEDPF